MRGKERPIVERTRDIIESDRTQDVLKAAGIYWLPKNASKVCVTFTGYNELEYEHVVVDQKNRELVKNRGQVVSIGQASELVRRGIPFKPVFRPGGKIIPRLTQKVESI